VKVVVILAASALLAAAAGCGGGDEEAATTVLAPAPTTASGEPASRIERRLSRAGYHVVANPTSDAELSLTTGVKHMIVYIAGFGSASAAADYARVVAATARKTPKQVIARRVGKNVYSAVAAESPTAIAAPGPLSELIAAAEGKRSRVIRVSPR
jgi:hypothetical protein